MASKATFDLKQLVPHIKRLAKVPGMLRPSDVEEMMNPAPKTSEADHWYFVGRMASECGEYTTAVACLDKVLTLEPKHLKALKEKLAVARETNEPAEARAVKARLDALTADERGVVRAGKKAAKKVTTGLSPDHVAGWYRAVGSTFFASAWYLDPRLGKPFMAWAKKAHPDLFKQQPRDPAMLERLIVEKEGAGAVAGFLDSLTGPKRALALRGVREDLLAAFGANPSKAQQAVLVNLDAACTS